MSVVPGKTFGELALAVAIALRVAVFTNPDDAADNRARLPDDPQRLQRCLLAVNDGLSLMELSYPKWTALRPTQTITLDPTGQSGECIAGDPSRYRLLPGVTGSPTGPLLIRGGGVGRSLRLPITSDARVLALLEASNSAAGVGPPQLAAVRPYMPSAEVRGGAAGGDRQGWELIIAPKPDMAYTVTGTFRIVGAKLVNLSDRHVFGAQHDPTVEAFAVWAARRYDTADPQRRAEAQALAEQMLNRSMELDGENVPQELGRGWPHGGDVGSDPFHRADTSVQINGQAVSLL